MISARHIWEVTKKQMKHEEDIILFRQRFTSTKSYKNSTLIDHMLNDVENDLTETVKRLAITTDCTQVNKEIERLTNIKVNILHQAIRTSERLKQNLDKVIEIEKQKFFLNNRFIQSTANWQKNVFDAIHNRHIHMIESATFSINCQKELSTLAD